MLEFDIRYDVWDMVVRVYTCIFHRTYIIITSKYLWFNFVFVLYDCGAI